MRNPILLKIILSLACLGAFVYCSVLSAQPAIMQQCGLCPKGHIESPSEKCYAPECTFNGSVAGWDPAIKPIVKWSVSRGKIISGQGTWSIKVDVSETRNESITVTLEVTGNGLDKVCEIKEMYEVKVCSKD